MNTTESHYELTIAEEDLGVFIRVYRSIKDSFHFNTRLMLLHIEDDVWEFRVLGLTTREWLEFCANVFTELPSETVDLVEEETEGHQEFPLSDQEVLAAEEEGDDEPETEEEEPEDVEDESPSEEVQRKLKRAKLVRKTDNPAVTVETV